MKAVGGNDERERKRKGREGEENFVQPQERVRRRDAPPPLHFNNYARLLQPRSAILAAIEGTGLLRLPPRTDKVLGASQRDYCRYHRARGHATDQCWELQNQIERLIREGHLQTYVQNNEEEPPRREERQNGQNARHQERGRNRQHEAPPDNEPTHQAIHVISGGETLAGDTSASRKAYARQAYQVNSVMKIQEQEEPITFTPNDRGDVTLPHDDPMVISAIIAKHPIDRVLVDSGSSVNLIYWNCFEQMQLSHDQLKKVASPLFSFSGEAIPVVGSIRLPVTLGTGPKNATQQANFMVVRTPSTAYNIILGRPLLNDMRAIVSSAYLLMKFPTPKGTGQVRGDQKKARACYVMSTKGKSPMS